MTSAWFCTRSTCTYASGSGAPEISSVLLTCTGAWLYRSPLSTKVALVRSAFEQKAHPGALSAPIRPVLGRVHASLYWLKKYLTKASAPSGVCSRAAAGMLDVSVGDGLADDDGLDGDDGSELRGTSVGLGVSSAVELHPASPTAVAATRPTSSTRPRGVGRTSTVVTPFRTTPRSARDDTLAKPSESASRVVHRVGAPPLPAVGHDGLPAREGRGAGQGHAGKAAARPARARSYEP
jgi:hypothetical protein